MKSIKLILGSLCLTLVISLNYLYPRYFNLKLIGKPIVDGEVGSPSEEGSLYNMNYLWEFKTMLYFEKSNGYMKEMKVNGRNRNNILKDVPEDTPVFLNCVPFKEPRDGRFKFEPLYLEEIDKIEGLVNKGEVELILLKYTFEEYYTEEDYIEKGYIEKKHIDEKNKETKELEVEEFFIEKEVYDKSSQDSSLYAGVKQGRVSRVTYVLDKKFNIWVPCFVTFHQQELVKSQTHLDFKGGDLIAIYLWFINVAESNYFTKEIIDKETKSKDILDIFFWGKVNEERLKQVKYIPGSRDASTNEVLEGVYEPTEEEKEMAKRAFAKYKGRKMVWDENSGAEKYNTLVNERGERLDMAKIGRPNYPYLEYDEVVQYEGGWIEEGGWTPDNWNRSRRK